MKTLLINKKGRHLIVYFAGWGTPPSLVKHLQIPHDSDLLICYDYDDLNCLFDFSSYQSIRIIAWSMGVWVAERIMHQQTLLSATAINGSGLPCHPKYGIPPHVFQGTLTNLSSQTRQYFERRMCGDKTTLSSYLQSPDYRTFDNIHNELHSLSQAITNDSRTDLIIWTHAFISQQDNIFPPSNLQQYWKSRCPIINFPHHHLLFQHFTHWADFWEEKHD